MSLHLYLLRHGETDFSVSGGFCGDVDAELTESGHKMAERFSLAHKHVKWSAVYCSPMKRTQATAAPLCKAVGIEPLLRDGLKEIRYGLWEGQTLNFVKENYMEDYNRWHSEPSWNAPTGGETAAQIAGRAMPVICEIQKKYIDGNVLLVSHKATIRIILCSLLGIELGRYRDRLDAPAGSVSRVRFNEHGPLLEILGDRSYMDAELLARAGT